jgi:hypothetical protein
MTILNYFQDEEKEVHSYLLGEVGAVARRPSPLSRGREPHLRSQSSFDLINTVKRSALPPTRGSRSERSLCKKKALLQVTHGLWL